MGTSCITPTLSTECVLLDILSSRYVQVTTVMLLLNNIVLSNTCICINIYICIGNRYFICIMICSAPLVYAHENLLNTNKLC